MLVRDKITEQCSKFGIQDASVPGLASNCSPLGLKKGSCFFIMPEFSNPKQE